MRWALVAFLLVCFGCSREPEVPVKTVAKILATHQGRIILYALETLSDEALADLRGNSDVCLPKGFLR